MKALTAQACLLAVGPGGSVVVFSRTGWLPVGGGPARALACLAPHTAEISWDLRIAPGLQPTRVCSQDSKGCELPLLQDRRTFNTDKKSRHLDAGPQEHTVSRRARRQVLHGWHRLLHPGWFLNTSCHCAVWGHSWGGQAGPAA